MNIVKTQTICISVQNNCECPSVSSAVLSDPARSIRNRSLMYADTYFSAAHFLRYIIALTATLLYFTNRIILYLMLNKNITVRCAENIS